MFGSRSGKSETVEQETSSPPTTVHAYSMRVTLSLRLYLPFTFQYTQPALEQARSNQSLEADLHVDGGVLRGRPVENKQLFVDKVFLLKFLKVYLVIECPIDTTFNSFMLKS